MAEIELSRGLVALVDDADFDLLSKFTWCAHRQYGGRFYAQARVTPGRHGKRALMHRFLMRPPRGLVVHHINNNGLDNRRANLMVTTPSRNTQFATHTSKTGYWATPKGFQAMTRIDGTRYNLGLHATERNARVAVQVAREVLRGMQPEMGHDEAKKIADRVRVGII